MKTSTRKSKPKPKSKPESESPLVAPDTSALSEDRDTLIKKNSELKVTDPKSYNYAMELVAACKTKVKAFEDKFAPSKKMLNDYKRQIDKDLRDLIQPVKDLANRAWNEAMGWKRKEEEAAEAKRIEDRRLAQERERKRLEEEAKEAEKEDKALAEEIRQTPVEIPLAPAAPVAPQSTAVSIRYVTSAEVVDIFALNTHIAKHPECINYIEANLVALNQVARAQGDALNIPDKDGNYPIPGVRSRKIPIAARR